MLILSYISAVEIAYAKVEDNVEEESKIEKSIIQAVIRSAHNILYGPVNAENVKRLY
jgi:hypothetical protein